MQHGKSLKVLIVLSLRSKLTILFALGAIIAREYGVTCVSGVDNATKLINDGDLLKLDGSAGTAQILREDEACTEVKSNLS